MLSPSDGPLTKRQLGWLIAAGGALLALASLGTYLLRLGAYPGFGPAKQQVLGLGLGLIAFGLTLVPLGERPA